MLIRSSVAINTCVEVVCDDRPSDVCWPELDVSGVIGGLSGAWLREGFGTRSSSSCWVLKHLADWPTCCSTGFTRWARCRLAAAETVNTLLAGSIMGARACIALNCV